MVIFHGYVDLPEGIHGYTILVGGDWNMNGWQEIPFILGVEESSQLTLTP